MWDMVDAAVVCRQLGLQSTGNHCGRNIYGYQGPDYFMERNGMEWADSVHCFTELNLNEKIVH